jgi:hypothetical protein
MNIFRRKTTHRWRGSSTLEFALAGSFIFLPLLAGTATVGVAMLRSMEVAGLNRDAGHMFATGVDFSQSVNRNLLLKVAGNLNITDTGGKGVVILSEIDGTGNNQAVCSLRLVIGNAALRQSSYVNPSSGVLDSAGNVTNLNDASASVAPAFLAMMPMTQGQVAYVVETYFSTSDYDWPGFLTGTGIYMKAVF